MKFASSRFICLVVEGGRRGGECRGGRLRRHFQQREGVVVAAVAAVGDVQDGHVVQVLLLLLGLRRNGRTCLLILEFFTANHTERGREEGGRRERIIIASENTLFKCKQ